jgi:hypothetical protein
MKEILNNQQKGRQNCGMLVWFLFLHFAAIAIFYVLDRYTFLLDDLDIVSLYIAIWLLAYMGFIAHFLLSMV